MAWPPSSEAVRHPHEVSRQAAPLPCRCELMQSALEAGCCPDPLDEALLERAYGAASTTLTSASEPPRRRRSVTSSPGA
jgi:hypothetical protein